MSGTHIAVLRPRNASGLRHMTTNHAASGSTPSSTVKRTQSRSATSSLRHHSPVVMNVHGRHPYPKTSTPSATCDPSLRTRNCQTPPPLSRRSATTTSFTCHQKSARTPVTAATPVSTPMVSVAQSTRAASQPDHHAVSGMERAA